MSRELPPNPVTWTDRELQGVIEKVVFFIRNTNEALFADAVMELNRRREAILDEFRNRRHGCTNHSGKDVEISGMATK